MSDDFLQNLEQEFSERDEFFSELHQRNEGLLSKTLKDQHAMIVGLGSVGSYIAEKLVRAGIGNLTIIDFDIVETHNLTRTTFLAEDIGKTKASCVKKNLLKINPYVIINVFDVKIQDIDKVKFRKSIEDSDILVSAVDDNTTTAILNRISTFYGLMSVTPGLYQKAEGGEVLFSIPRVTPCIECAIHSRYDIEKEQDKEVSRVNDYGTGNLAGELAIAPDIHHVSGIAAKITLSMLSLLSPERVEMENFIGTALSDKTTFLMLGMSPSFPLIHPFINENSYGQYAYQSLWVTTQSWDDCPVCGLHSKNTVDDPIEDLISKVSFENIKFEGLDD